MQHSSVDVWELGSVFQLVFVVCVPLCETGCGPLPLEPSDPDPGSVHFRIATFNVEVQHFGDMSTVDAVGATEADIVCLQEVSDEWEAVLRRRYSEAYEHMLFEPGGAAGLGILSRWPLSERALLEAPKGWHPAWHVVAETPAGPLELLIVHLRSLYSGENGVVDDFASWEADHRLELDTHLAAMDGSSGYAFEIPRIVLGDFNEDPDGSSLRYVESLGFRNALPLYHPGQFTWRHASVGGQFNLAIDHILFDAAMKPLNAFVVDAGNSDHLPVVAHLQALATWHRSEPLQARETFFARGVGTPSGGLMRAARRSAK